MSNLNATIATRRKIAQDFCRNILWIDDQILPKETDIAGNEYRDFFIPITEQLQCEGVLVNLLSFTAPNTGDESDDPLLDSNFQSMETAKKSAAGADVILLDWHLADEDSPRHCKKLLEHIAQSSSTQLVLILTRKADNFLDELNSEGLLGEDKTFQLVETEESVTLTSRTGTHVTLVSKNDIATEAPEEATRKANEQASKKIRDIIFELINTVYPDYLHWTALEIAAEIRNHYPEWLHSLPHGTDIAVLQELLDDQSEINQSLPENLREDLIETAKLRSIKSLEPNNTQRADWPNKSNHPNIVDNEYESDSLKVIHLQALPLNLHATLSSSEGLNETVTVFEKILAHAENSESDAHSSASEWLNSHFTYSEFVESVSIRTHSNEPTQGGLFKDRNGSLFVCASQPCDCARGRSVLLIKAAKSATTKKSSTSFRHEGSDYRFDGITDKLKQESVHAEGDGNRNLANYEKVGQLRPAIAARIISRYWSALTRPAVNHPTFVRKLREKE